MAPVSESYVEAAERLCDTLERIGDALVTLDTPTLLETEESLGRLIAVMSSRTVADRAALERIVRRSRAALLRCRRLGASYNATARVRLQLCTSVGHYGPDGDLVERAVPSPMLKATA
jgi:hypothetical protein